MNKSRRESLFRDNSPLIEQTIKLFVRNTALERSLAFENIERHLPENIEVFGGIFSSRAAIVLAENHVESPMEAVFGRPMTALALCELLRSHIFDAVYEYE